MTFDDLLKECGEFGLYQKLLILGCLLPSMLMVAVYYWIQVFIFLVPPHRCKLGPVDDTFDTGNESSNHDALVERCSYQNNGSLTGDTASCPYGYNYDYSLHYPTFASENNWVCDNAWKMYTVHTCYWTGTVFGSVIFGFFSDRFGRKLSYQVSACLSLTSAVATLYIKKEIPFFIARFCSAVGEGNIAIVTYVLVMEYTGPKNRGLNLFVWQFTYAATSSLMPWIAYGVRDWKYLLQISWIPSVLAIFLSFFTPESASWLLTRGRMKEAAELLHNLSRINGKGHSLEYIAEKLQKEVNGEERKNELSDNTIVTETAISNEVKHQNVNLSFLRTTIEILKLPNMRRKTISFILIWMVACMNYTGNSLESVHLPYNFYIIYTIGAIVEIPGNIYCIMCLDKFGRRWSDSCFFIVGGVLGILSGCVSAKAAVITMALIMRCCYAASYDITFTFSSESFPTEIRGRGISIIRIFGGSGSAIAPFIVSLAEKEPLLPLIVFGSEAIFAGILTLFLPETAREQLPHSLEEGENFGPDQSFWFCPLKKKQNESATMRITNVSSGKTNLTFDSNENGIEAISIKTINY